MNTLQKLMVEIQKYKNVVNTKPSEEATASVRRMQEGNVRQAKEQLRDLYHRYRKSMRDNSLFMVVVGSTQDKFAEKARKDYGTYTFAADELLTILVDQIPTQLYTNQYMTRALLDFVNAKFEDRAMEIDIVSYNRIIMKNEYKKPIKDKQDLIKQLRPIFTKTIGGEVFGLDAIAKTAHIAVNEGFDGKVIPMLLKTEDVEFATQLAQDLKRISKNVKLIQSGNLKEEFNTDLTIDKITDINMKELFLKIKEKLK